MRFIHWKLESQVTIHYCTILKTETVSVLYRKGCLFSPVDCVLVLLEEILHQDILLYYTVSHLFEGFVHPRWCKISSINRMFTPAGWTAEGCTASSCCSATTKGQVQENYVVQQDSLSIEEHQYWWNGKWIETFTVPLWMRLWVVWCCLLYCTCFSPKWGDVCRTGRSQHWQQLTSNGAELIGDGWRAWKNSVSWVFLLLKT